MQPPCLMSKPLRLECKTTLVHSLTTIEPKGFVQAVKIYDLPSSSDTISSTLRSGSCRLLDPNTSRLSGMYLRMRPDSTVKTDEKTRVTKNSRVLTEQRKISRFVSRAEAECSA